MAQKKRLSDTFGHFSQGLPDTTTQGDDPWQSQLNAVAQRFNREYNRDAFDLPPEVEAMPVFRDWATGGLQARIASPFWDLVQPKKHEHWLDIGCGFELSGLPLARLGCFLLWPRN